MIIIVIIDMYVKFPHLPPLPNFDSEIVNSRAQILNKLLEFVRSLLGQN